MTSTPPVSSPLQSLRSASQYLYARKAIKVGAVIYIIAAVLGLIAAMTSDLNRRGVIDDDFLTLMRVTGFVVNIAGALVVREFLYMVVDLVDRAIDRRADHAAAPSGGPTP